MPNHSPLSNDSIAPSSPETERQHDGRRQRLVRSVKGPIQFLGFWVAITLPFVHVPLLVRGLDEPGVTAAFLGLVAVNLLALYAGHGYNQP
ncbi:hypothetical protein ACFOZ7_22375 [Natribaculum luteum]|uniref:Uncharacterized protein n=1 Tax=Natribaculum luteum TaxID=1586232 RepID=A0ABD5P5X2_9EURY|nr:hypothetical protein [Natribaculum luteum]